MIKEYEAKIIEEDGILKDILYKCDKEKTLNAIKEIVEESSAIIQEIKDMQQILQRQRICK